MKGFPNSATSYKVKQCSILRISTLWALNFVVNLSKLSFFSSKITLNILRKAASSFLIQNILSSDSSTEKNSRKTPNRLLWRGANHWPFLFPHLTKWRDLLWIVFPDNWEIKRRKKKSNEVIHINFKITRSFWGKKMWSILFGYFILVEFFQILF